MKAGQSYPDFLACWHGMLALLAALHHRDESGRGQWIDLGMYPLGATVVPEAVIDHQATGRVHGPLGNVDRAAFVSGIFATKDPDRWIAVSVSDPVRLTALAEIAPLVAEVAALADPGAAESAAVLRGALASWLGELTADEATRLLQDLGVAAGPLLSARDLLEDEHLRARAFYEWVDVDGVGPRPLIGRPYRWHGGDEPPRITRAAPRFGEHNREVLCGELGKSEDDFARLVAAGVTREAPLAPPPGAPQPLAVMAARGTIVVDPDYCTHLDALRPVP
jgi:crotonobetainyl-CoA:carnitine CoA-transferase CaiB-like acyl-CoA transferase